MANKQEENDQKIQEFFAVVEKEKKEISRAEKPNWKTNCSFRYDRESANTRNIQTISDKNELVSIMAFIISQEASHDEACKMLDVEDSKFTWLGFSTADWASDIKTRINKIEIVKKKAKLEMMEERLNKILSPELRTQLELASIAKELNLKS